MSYFQQVVLQSFIDKLISYILFKCLVLMGLFFIYINSLSTKIEKRDEKSDWKKPSHYRCFFKAIFILLTLSYKVLANPIIKEFDHKNVKSKITLSRFTTVVGG